MYNNYQRNIKERISVKSSAKPRLSTDKHIGKHRSVFAQRKKIDGCFPLHRHEYFEVEIILDGKGTQILNGHSCPLSRGAVYFLTPADFHEIRVEEPLTLYNISFETASVPPSLSEQTLKKEGCVFYPPPPEFSRLVHIGFLLSDAFSDIHAQQSSYIDHLLSCLVIRLTDIISTADDRAALSASPSVREVLLYMHLHFRETVTLSTLAGYAHLSPNYLSELFRSETGSTVMQYLTGLRIGYAKKLLSSTTLSVTDICFSCGFSSLSNFMKSFKNHTGFSPLNYRKQQH